VCFSLPSNSVTWEFKGTDSLQQIHSNANETVKPTEKEAIPEGMVKSTDKSVTSSPEKNNPKDGCFLREKI
jgi:hypothetical protein